MVDGANLIALGLGLGFGLGRKIGEMLRWRTFPPVYSVLFTTSLHYKLP